MFVLSLMGIHQIKLPASGLNPVLKFMEDSSSGPKSIDYGSVKRKIEEDKSSSFQTLYRQKLASVEAKMKQSREMEVEDTLSEEILELQKRLQEQFLVRHALERALTNRPCSLAATHEKSIPKDVMKLIKDIAVLELEVVYLEQYLLSMYRKTFEQQHSSATATTHEGPKQTPITLKECSDIWSEDKLSDSSIHIHRTHSSVSQPSTCLARASSSSRKLLAKAVDSYHSLPLSMLECTNSNTMISLAEHLGTCVPDHVQETPNWVSEEMIRSISAIYCKLTDPPLLSHDIDTPSPPTSFSSFNSQSDNPFRTGSDSKELGRSNHALVKIHGIPESHKLEDVEHMLQKFRSLVHRLVEVNPRKMKHEEKLAFWINTHNALIMHAFLVYGTLPNNLKTTSLLLKAAYNVGGHTISVEMIQSSILGCRMARPGQWLWSLFSSKTKLKARDARRSYAIEHSEPRLHFALCSGTKSDPPVRIYRPKSIFLELESAKEEYIASTMRTHKDHKILLPKIVESFAKDSGLCPVGLADMIEQFKSSSWRERKVQNCQQRKASKSIEWVPHDFSFRYMLSGELAL